MKIFKFKMCLKYIHLFTYQLDTIKQLYSQYIRITKLLISNYEKKPFNF